MLPPRRTTGWAAPLHGVTFYGRPSELSLTSARLRRLERCSIARPAHNTQPWLLSYVPRRRVGSSVDPARSLPARTRPARPAAGPRRLRRELPGCRGGRGAGGPTRCPTAPPAPCGWSRRTPSVPARCSRQADLDGRRVARGPYVPGPGRRRTSSPTWNPAWCTLPARSWRPTWRAADRWMFGTRGLRGRAAGVAAAAPRPPPLRPPTGGSTDRALALSRVEARLLDAALPQPRGDPPARGARAARGVRPGTAARRRQRAGAGSAWCGGTRDRVRPAGRLHADLARPGPPRARRAPAQPAPRLPRPPQTASGSGRAPAATRSQPLAVFRAGRPLRPSRSARRVFPSAGDRGSVDRSDVGVALRRRNGDHAGGAARGAAVQAGQPGGAGPAAAVVDEHDLARGGAAADVRRAGRCPSPSRRRRRGGGCS